MSRTILLSNNTKKLFKQQRKNIYGSQQKLLDYCSENDIIEITRRQIKESENRNETVNISSAEKLAELYGLENHDSYKQDLYIHYLENPIKDNEDCLRLIKKGIVKPFNNYEIDLDYIHQLRKYIYSYLDSVKYKLTEKEKRYDYEFLKAAWIESEFYNYTLIYGEWERMINDLFFLAKEAKRRNDYHTELKCLRELYWIKVIRKNPKELREASKYYKDMLDCYEDKPEYKENKLRIISCLMGLKLRQKDLKDFNNLTDLYYHSLNNTELNLYEEIHHQVLINYLKANYFALQSQIKESYNNLNSAQEIAYKNGYTRALIHTKPTQFFLEVLINKEPDKVREQIAIAKDEKKCKRETRCYAYLIHQMANLEYQQGNNKLSEHWRNEANNYLKDLGIQNSIDYQPSLDNVI